MQLSKFYFILLLIFISSCAQPLSSSQSQSQPFSSELTITAAAHKFIDSQANLLNKKYNMKSSGFGTSLYDGVKELSWNFHIPKKLPRDEGRILIMDCVSQIVNNANNNDELKLFFNKEGFDQKNIEVVIVVDLGKQEVYYPDFKVINYRNNRLGFYTDDPKNNTKTFYTCKYEPYEDAVAILKSQSKKDASIEPELKISNKETN